MKLMRLLLILILLPGIAAEKSLGQESELEDLRQKVAASENRYEQMEATYEQRDWVPERVVAEAARTDKTLENSRQEITGVWSGEKYFARNARTDIMGDGSVKRRIQVQAFDGTKTRLNHYGEIGNIVNERVREYSVKPCYLGMPYFGTSANLSEILDFVPHTGDYLSRLNKWGTVEYVYHGEEKRGDTELIKVELVVSPGLDKPDLKQRHFIWISPQHNYLPAAIESFDSYHGSEPHRITQVLEWNEIEPGVWMPSISKVQTYEVDDKGARSLLFTSYLEIKSCKLKSSPDDPRFASVEFEKGLTVYVVENGKIIDEYVEGQPDNDPKQDGDHDFDF